MVVIRLARGGSKSNLFYNVVVADQRCPRDGRFIERVGYFSPLAKGKTTRLELMQNRIEHWIGKGAKPSDRVSKLMKKYADIANAQLAESLKTEAKAAEKSDDKKGE